MKTTKIATFSNTDKTLYAKEGENTYRAVKVANVSIQTTDTAGTFETTFIDDGGEEYSELFLKDGEVFDPVNESFLSWGVGARNTAREGDRCREIHYDAERNSFYLTAYRLNENGSERLYINEVLVKAGESKMDVTAIVPPFRCLNFGDEFLKFHREYTEVGADGVETRKESIASRVLLTAEEKEYLDDKFSKIAEFCKARGIKIGYDTECCEIIAGHVDDFTYDCWEDEKDVHLGTGMLQVIKGGSFIRYSGCDDEFVLYGAKVPQGSETQG